MSGRDSYLYGKCPRPAMHDVNARRDGLPDNVFAYLKEQVTREQYDVHSAEQHRLAGLAAAGRGGKRILKTDAGRPEEEAAFVAVEHKTHRHARLRALYQQELQVWRDELRERGLDLDLAQTA